MLHEANLMPIINVLIYMDEVQLFGNLYPNQKCINYPVMG